MEGAERHRCGGCRVGEVRGAEKEGVGNVEGERWVKA